MTHIFHQFPESSIAAIRGASGFWQRQAGQHLFHEGDPAESLYIVLKGKVEIYCSGSNGEVRLRTSGPGEIIGEIGLLGSKNQRSASARATELTTLYEIESQLPPLLERIADWKARFQLLQNLMALLLERLMTKDVSDVSEIRSAADPLGDKKELPPGFNVIERNLPSALFGFRRKREVLYPAARLFEIGDPSDGFWVIHNGSLHAFGESGRALGTIDAPTLVGAEGFFACQPRSAVVVATKQVECTYFSRPRFEKLKASHPQEALEIMFAAAQLTVGLILQREGGA